MATSSGRVLFPSQEACLGDHVVAFGKMRSRSVVYNLSTCFLGLFLAERENRHKRILRDFHASDHLHTFFALFLFL